jgi:RNA recognition motif-containing protein
MQGAGYVEFGSSEEADKAMKQDGKELLGRNIRLDWTS